MPNMKTIINNHNKRIMNCETIETNEDNKTNKAIAMMRRKSPRSENIYFNQPYNENINFNLGKQLINLIDKHFPKDHKLHKIFNRNTTKLSLTSIIKES